MKKLIFLLTIPIFLLLASYTFDISKSKAVGPPTVVDLSDGVLTINGVALVKPMTIQQYESILGKADKVYPLSNTIHTYNNRGMILYQTPGEDEVLAFNMYYGKAKVSFMPKNLFNGTLTINGLTITPDLSESEIVKLLPQYNFVESYGYKRGAYMGMYVFLNYDRKKGKLKYVNIGYNLEGD